jgi:hypothetical protein
MALDTSWWKASPLAFTQPRFTKDLDLFVQADSANARATYAALAEFGVPLKAISPEDFADRGSFFRFVSRMASIFFRPFPALILMRHGNGGLQG